MQHTFLLIVGLVLPDSGTFDDPQLARKRRQSQCTDQSLDRCVEVFAQRVFSADGGLDQGKGPDPMDAMFGKEVMDQIRAGKDVASAT